MAILTNHIGGIEPHLFAASSAAQVPHERVFFSHDRDSGLQAIVAIHDTRRGPAYGGCRINGYSSVQEALNDALRLSEAMSLKNALAELPYGGGSAVIIEPQKDYDRTQLLYALGNMIEQLRGDFIGAPGLGSSSADMLTVSQRTRFVGASTLDDGRGGNPAPYTAYGLVVAMRAAARQVLCVNELAGLNIAVQGLGAVGSILVELLYEAGANLIVSDTRSSATEHVASTFGARVVTPDQIIRESCDILAPCAHGAVFDKTTIPQLRTRLICGAANNQLATAPDGQRLKDRGITYLPDFLVNAGGAIFSGLEYRGQGGESEVHNRIDGIDGRVRQLLKASKQSGVDTHLVAERWARQLIAGPRSPIEEAAHA
ncbi:MAG: Glu/Leu/Phe/Val dehydrogenase dimerization domain-containing protein [Burkholderiaceae bacterium]